MTELVVRREYNAGVFVIRIINGVISLIEAALALRLILQLFGASAASQFVAFVYGVTNRLLGSFAGAFPNISLGGGYVIDVTAIFAMIGYAILGWLIVRLVSFIFAATDMP